MRGKIATQDEHGNPIVIEGEIPDIEITDQGNEALMTESSELNQVV